MRVSLRCFEDSTNIDCFGNYEIIVQCALRERCVKFLCFKKDNLWCYYRANNCLYTSHFDYGMYRSPDSLCCSINKQAAINLCKGMVEKFFHS